MGKQEELPKLVYTLRESGVDVEDLTVVADGVLFQSHKPAVIFAERHDKDLVRVDGRTSSWLARNKD